MEFPILVSLVLVNFLNSNMLPVLCETGLVDDSEGAISNNFLSLVGFWSRFLRFFGHNATSLFVNAYQVPKIRVLKL